MTRRHEDGFYYQLSSAGCLNIFPENQANCFRILVSDPLDFPDDEDWEVALLDMYYPCTWSNIGPGTWMKYTLGNTVKEFKFPSLQCQSFKEIVDYITMMLPKNGYTVSIDSFGRFCLESKDTYCNEGFSDSLRRILGVSDDQFSLSSMKERIYSLELISPLWKEEINPMQTNQDIFDKIIAAENDMIKIMKILKPFMNIEKLKDTEIERASFPNPKIEHLWDEIAEIFQDETLNESMKSNLRNFQRRFTFVYGSKRRLLPKMMTSTSPPVLNPVEFMQVRMSIIQLTDVDNKAENILKTVYVDGFKSDQKVYVNPTYVPVKKGGKISYIDVYITKMSGELVPFEGGTVWMTLHFRKHKY